MVLGEELTSIGSRAFAYCGKLKVLEIPSSVKSIGEAAFSGCNGLLSIIVAEGNTVYHSWENCLIETATKILVLGCQTSQIPFDGSVEGIGDSAFANCSGLTSIVLPSGVTSIGDSAFANCSRLTSIELPDSLTSIGSYAFYLCGGLTGSLKIPDSVTNIGEHAFSNCGGLTGSLKIPDSVTNIGEHAFSNCSGLISVTIGNGVTNIDETAFSGCNGLLSIIVAEGNTVYHSEGNCLIETTTKILVLGCQTSQIPSDGSVVRVGSWD